MGLRQAIVIFATLLSLFPVYFMAVSAFKTKSQYLANKWGLPLQPTLANFSTALAGEKFFIRFANSLILTVGAVVLVDVHRQPGGLRLCADVVPRQEVPSSTW